MNPFTYDEKQEICPDFRYEMPTRKVLESMLLADSDYQSKILWRYYSQVLDQLRGEHCDTFLGVDRGFVLCYNEPIYDAVKALEGEEGWDGEEAAFPVFRENEPRSPKRSLRLRALMGYQRIRSLLSALRELANAIRMLNVSP